MEKYLHLGNLLLIIVMVILLVYFGRAMKNSRPEVVFTNNEALWFYFLGLVAVLISIGVHVWYLSYKPKVVIPIDVLNKIKCKNQPKKRKIQQMRRKTLSDLENPNELKQCPISSRNSRREPEKMPTVSSLSSKDVGEKCFVVKSQPNNSGIQLNSLMP